ncbi:DUF1642 domain-containing protein [Enterococcus dongliensis]|uniref:DUF1642 domain-containing protein n=1 Tax=Enterococcus dongliensis TaxID=2559925 RepID=UPI00288C96FA|nr:DUF1642 domain-containing protein [Enterococcus dongliensis]MDT2648050.1 DUF1642 domain-containing protein [Enterococcus dongliensis]
MEKQELIEKLREHGAWCTECHDINGKKDRYVKAAKVRELLDQLDEPQKVKVPELPSKIAKYLEWAKEEQFDFTEDYNMISWGDLRKFGGDDTEYLQMWFFDNDQKENERRHILFLQAYTDGYEVEEEPKWVVKSNRLYFTGITQLIARDPITYNFTTDEKRAHVFDDKESAEKEASFFDGTVEKVEV